MTPGRRKCIMQIFAGGLGAWAACHGNWPRAGPTGESRLSLSHDGTANAGDVSGVSPAGSTRVTRDQSNLALAVPATDQVESRAARAAGRPGPGGPARARRPGVRLVRDRDSLAGPAGSLPEP